MFQKCCSNIKEDVTFPQIYLEFSESDIAMKISKGLSLILCVFFLKAVANTVADRNLSFWDTFEWELSLQRSKQDEFVLKGFLDDKQAKLEIPAATCNETEVFRKLPQKRRNGFLMHCRCDLQSSSFIPEFKLCAANSYLKQGCRYTTGSWRWPRWTWDKVNDSLIVMDKEGYGVTTAFNATTREYTKCSVESISYWKKNMEWIAIGTTNGSKISFFKLQEFWHISWNIEDLNADVKKSIEGKILKFMIECETNEEQDEDETLSSCLIFKVSGKLQFTSTFNDTSTTPPTTTAAPTDAGSEESNTVIILAASLCFIAIVIIIIISIFCCVRKRRASFAVTNNQSTEAHVTMTQLLSENPDETIV